MTTLLHLLESRPHFRRLWTADVLATLGHWFTFAAVSKTALEKTGGALTIALLIVAHDLPNVLVAPWAGKLADRFDRRQIMLRSDELQAALTLAVAVALTAEWFSLVQALLFARVAASTAFHAAFAAALPGSVPPAELTRANAISSATTSTTSLLGVVLSGVLVTILGATVAIVLDATCYMLANLALRGLPRWSSGRATRADNSLRVAWAHALRHGRVFAALLAKAPLAFASGAAWVVLVRRAPELSSIGSVSISLSLLQLSRAAGNLLAPPIHLALERSGVQSAVISFGGLLGTCLGIALLAGCSSAALVLAGGVLWGAGITVNWILAQSTLQRLAPNDMLGRLVAIDLLSFTGMSSLGALSCGVLLEVGASNSGGASAGLVGCIIAWVSVTVLAKRLHARPFQTLSCESKGEP